MSVQTVVETFGMTGREFICKHCAFQGQAWVVASGEGQSGGVGERAASHAARHAASDADRVADRSLLFAQCPKCGEKDPAGARFRIRRLGLVFGLPIAIIALGILLARGMDSPSDLMMILVPGTMAVIAGIQLYFSVRRPWYRAEHRVSFEGFDKPDDEGDRWV